MPLGFAKHILTAADSAIDLGFYKQAGAVDGNNEAAKKITGLADHAERDYTFACWFRAVDADFDSAFDSCEPLTQGPGSGSGDYQGNIKVDIHKNNGVTAMLFGLAGGGGTTFSTGNLSSSFNGTYIDGNWHHLFVHARFGSSTLLSKIYLDGVDKTTNALGSTISLHASTTMGSVAYILGKDSSVLKENTMDISQIWYEYGDNSNWIAGDLQKWYDNGPVDMGTDGTASGLGAPEVFIYISSAPAVTQGGSVGSIANTTGSNSFTVSATGGPTN
jgi:hypothetical protein|tara:strand:+ start:553 stop:1377 length:825 start_codon:yes stop_codon:yes gene_type:complete